MRCIILATMFAVGLSRSAIGADYWNAGYFVAELNKISFALRYPARTPIENDLVLDVGCKMLNAAIAEDVATKMAVFMDRHSGSQTWVATNEGSFESYEAALFKKFGASGVTVALIKASIANEASSHQQPWMGRLDNSDRDLEDLKRALRGTARKACELTENKSPRPSEPPPTDANAPSASGQSSSSGEPAHPKVERNGESEVQRTEVANQVGKAALGVTVMVVDAAATISFPNVAVISLSFASGGWGWNRVEEAYFEIIKQR